MFNELDFVFIQIKSEKLACREKYAIYLFKITTLSKKYCRDFLPNNLNVPHKKPEQGFCLALSLVFLKIRKTKQSKAITMQQVPILSYSFFCLFLHVTCLSLHFPAFLTAERNGLAENTIMFRKIIGLSQIHYGYGLHVCFVCSDNHCTLMSCTSRGCLNFSRRRITLSVCSCINVVHSSLYNTVKLLTQRTQKIPFYILI